ncbi:hypothetical protein LJY18_16640 [Pseudomonas sp. MMS21-TM103]|uniref:hypothetical protein n=1 Tax=Pseudomonas sp. MMS21 TM103 TaxID=2886506 RepID=UPI001EE08BEB|nr:hypothetical protein [Pseudomonas sp. MMS21 TM103]MCG4454911.1 hypothetical protein [Pseudomonas sp. MMS21 TM103]
MLIHAFIIFENYLGQSIVKIIAKESSFAGVIGVMVSAVVAFLAAYCLVSAQLNLLYVSIGNALCGFFSGFFSGLMSGLVGVNLVLINIADN